MNTSKYRVKLEKEERALRMIIALWRENNDFKSKISIKGNIAEIEIFSFDGEVIPREILKPIDAFKAEQKAKKVLEPFAKQAVSFEQFITLLEEYFEIGIDDKVLFENLLIIATETDKIIWSNLNLELSRKGYFYDAYTINKLAAHISDRCFVTMVPFLEVIKRLNEQYFLNEDVDTIRKNERRNWNKLQESVILRDKIDVKHMARAYLRNSNPKSSISIEGNKAEIEIFFRGETPPKAIVKVIENCKNYESVTKKLKQMAEKATCFEEFITALEEFLEISGNLERKRLFRKLVMASTKIDKITWGDLEREVSKCGRLFTERERNKLRDQISKKSSVTIFYILEETKKIWEQYFKNEKLVIEEEKTPEKAENKLSETAKVATGTKHMLSILSSEETLSSIDRSKSIRERVQYVLEKMNWDRLTVEEQDKIADFASYAIENPEVDLDATFKEMRTSEAERVDIIIKFTLLINAFVKEKNPKCSGVPIETFLFELRDFIL